MKYTRKTEWRTHLGNIVSVEGMSDEHLANSIQYTKYYFNNDVLACLKREAKRRGLTKEFLDRAPFPYKDGKGNWIVWDYIHGSPKVIGSYIKR